MEGGTNHFVLKRVKRMRINLVDRVLKNRKKFNLSAADTATLVNLAVLSGEKSHPICEKIEDIASNIGYSSRTVRRSLQSLQKKQFVTLVGEATRPKNLPNLYSLNIKVFGAYNKKGGSL